MNVNNLVKKTAVAAVLTLGVYLVLFFYVDRIVDTWLYTNCRETWVYYAGTYLSLLADGPCVRLGIALCFILVIICDPGIKHHWTRYMLYICISGAVALVIGDGLKYLLGRYRPIMLFEHNLYGLHFFSAEWAKNSTPSGHTIRAFTLMTALSILYRRRTVIFISAAILIGISRVVVTAHYPSDVLFGAFIGIFTALWVYKHFSVRITRHGPLRTTR
jgi:membrane-associated phospholipid phosphatase